MHRISPDNPVRRKLFPVENLEEQAIAENDTNRFKEELTREVKEKSMKWNFDLVNEVALEGDYEWYKKDGDTFVRMIPVNDKIPSNKPLPMQYENENTPRSLKQESAPILRKRKKDIDSKIGNTAVKRKISLD